MEVLTVHQAAERARTEVPGVSERLIREMLRDGRLPYVRSGNRKLIVWQSLCDALLRGETAAPACPPVRPRLPRRTQKMTGTPANAEP